MKTGNVTFVNRDTSKAKRQSLRMPPAKKKNSSEQGIRKLTQLSLFKTSDRVAMRRVKLSLEEIYTFASQLAILLESGVPLVNSLSILSQQTQKPGFHLIIDEVIANISAGISFAAALARYDQVFPKLFVSLVMSAEKTGNLPEALTQVATYLKEQDKLDKKLKSAVVYPKFVFAFFSIILAAILFFLLPKFKDTFASLGAELPAATRYLMAFSDFAIANIIPECIFLIAVFLSLKFLKGTERGTFIFAKAQLKLPLIGDLIHKTSLSRLCRTLRILLKSGVGLVDALDLAANTAQSVVFKNVLFEIKKGVIEGNALADVLATHEIFPKLVVTMISTGEQSGSIEIMLNNISELYDTNVDSKINGLTSILEPALMVGLGLIAVVVILALYLPIFNLGNLNF